MKIYPHGFIATNSGDSIFYKKTKLYQQYELDSKIIIEFKSTKNSNEVEAKLDDGVNQILARDYGASFDCNKDRLKFAVVYDANLRKLAAFKEC